MVHGWCPPGPPVPYPVELHVEAAGVAHGLPLGVASPQRGGAGVAVGAAQARPARRVLLPGPKEEETQTPI